MPSIPERYPKNSGRELGADFVTRNGVGPICRVTNLHAERLQPACVAEARLVPDRGSVAVLTRLPRSGWTHYSFIGSLPFPPAGRL